MSKGRCLCGSVSWEISAGTHNASHCHCSMCRKAHGAAYGTYCDVPHECFRWTSKRESIVKYASSPEVERPFCRQCGSVVPVANNDGQYMVVPAGSHDEGIIVDSHIFVGSKAPWHEITDDLPRHDVYPPDHEGPVCEQRDVPCAPPGAARGSCLCGAVEFQVLEPFKVVYNCFCSRCRRARAATHATNGFTAMDGVRYTRGQARLSSYRLPSARFFTQVFCDVCGAGLPRVDAQRNIAVTPLGALDDDPGIRPAANIFVSHKAGWHDITDDLPAYEEGLPG